MFNMKLSYYSKISRSKMFGQFQTVTTDDNALPSLIQSIDKAIVLHSSFSDFGRQAIFNQLATAVVGPSFFIVLSAKGDGAIRFYQLGKLVGTYHGTMTLPNLVNLVLLQ